MLGRTDFSGLFWVLKAGPKAPAPYVTLADAQAAGAVTLNYGVFINNLVAFAIVAVGAITARAGSWGVSRHRQRLTPLSVAMANLQRRRKQPPNPRASTARRS